MMLSKRLIDQDRDRCCGSQNFLGFLLEVEVDK